MAIGRNRRGETLGQALCLTIFSADLYELDSARIPVPSGRSGPEHWYKNWLDGMSRSLRERFSVRLQQVRAEVGVTQRELAQIAGMSANGLAMIERGERLPSFDTAARICWALDIADGLTAEDLK